MKATSAVVGLDVGGTKILGLRVSPDGNVESEERVETPGEAGPLIDALIRLSSSLCEAPTAIGVGVPGLVDGEGVLRFAPNLPGIEDLDVRGALTAALGVPVQVDNDATCAAWGEKVLGAARGMSEVVMVTLGTGIGGGIIIGGSIYRGAHGFAGEIGHMVVDRHGPPCVCGNRGCWELYASGSGLGRLAREAAHAGGIRDAVGRAGGDPDAVKGEHVTRSAECGDFEALALLDELAEWVAVGLANLASIFDPEAFVIGGGLIDAGAMLIDPVARQLASRLESASRRPPVPVLAAQLGERAGAVGASGLAREMAAR